MARTIKHNSNDFFKIKKEEKYEQEIIEEYCEICGTKLYDDEKEFGVCKDCQRKID